MNGQENWKFMSYNSPLNFTFGFFFTYFDFPIAPTVFRRNLLSGLGRFFCNSKKYIFAFFYADVRETHYLEF